MKTEAEESLFFGDTNYDKLDDILEQLDITRTSVLGRAGLEFVTASYIEGSLREWPYMLRLSELKKSRLRWEIQEQGGLFVEAETLSEAIEVLCVCTRYGENPRKMLEKQLAEYEKRSEMLNETPEEVVAALGFESAWLEQNARDLRGGIDRLVMVLEPGYRYTPLGLGAAAVTHKDRQEVLPDGGGMWTEVQDVVAFRGNFEGVIPGWGVVRCKSHAVSEAHGLGGQVQLTVATMEVRAVESIEGLQGCEVDGERVRMYGVAHQDGVEIFNNWTGRTFFRVEVRTLDGVYVTVLAGKYIPRGVPFLKRGDTVFCEGLLYAGRFNPRS